MNNNDTTTVAIQERYGARRALPGVEDPSIEVDDNKKNFVRDVDCSALATEFGWQPDVSRFLLERHSLRQIRAFASPSAAALRRGLWLYALDEQDFAKSRLVRKNDDRTHMNLYWYRECTKEIYKIGDNQYYALFASTERDLVDGRGKALYDVTVRTTPKLAKILDPDVAYADIADTDDDDDDDGAYCDDEDSRDTKRPVARGGRKPLTEEQRQRKRERDRARRQRLKEEREGKTPKKASRKPAKTSKSRRPKVIEVHSGDEDDERNSVDDDVDGDYTEESTASVARPEAPSAPVVAPAETKKKQRDEEADSAALVLFEEQAAKKLCLAAPTGEQQQMVVYQQRNLELETERRICLAERDRDMTQLRAQLAQLEMEKRLAIMETEKRASDERAQLLLGVQDRELRVRDKEIALLREKETFLMQKCDAMGRAEPTAQRDGENRASNSFTLKTGMFSPFLSSCAVLTRAVTPDVPVAPVAPVAVVSPPMAPDAALLGPLVTTPRDPYRAMLHARLSTVWRDNRFNLSIETGDAYELRDILHRLLLANQRGAPLSAEDDALLRSPLLDDNLIVLLPNNDAALPDQARMDQVFDRASHANRQNISNMLLQLSFVRKAREFGDLRSVSSKTGEAEVKNRIEVSDELRFDYGNDCASLWFPRFSCGLATIVSPAMRFYAVSLKSGPGDNKCCPFCCKNYANYSAGNIKFMHQLPGCDVLANLSQNERVVLEKILAHRLASQQFASHPMVAPYSEQSILRRATPEEVRTRQYMRCKLTGDKLRLNMPVYMTLRDDTYEEFLARLRALATSKKPLFNLNAAPLAYLFDPLGLTGPVVRRAPPAQPGAPPKKKELVPPKRKLEMMSERERQEKNQRDATLRCRNSFLGRVLLNHAGENFLDNLPVRDFSIDEYGFGDGMYFESVEDQQTRERREKVVGINESHPANAALRHRAPQQPVGPLPFFNFNFPMTFAPPDPSIMALITGQATQPDYTANNNHNNSATNSYNDNNAQTTFCDAMQSAPAFDAAQSTEGMMVDDDATGQNALSYAFQGTPDPFASFNTNAYDTNHNVFDDAENPFAGASQAFSYNSSDF